MKKGMMILLLIVLTFSLPANESKKQKEIGILFSSLNNFGLTYRTGTEKGLWRFNALTMHGQSIDDSGLSDIEVIEDSTSFLEGKIEEFNRTFDLSTSFGKEFRKNIDGKLIFRYGFDVIFHFYYSNRKYKEEIDSSLREYYEKRTKYEPGIGFLIGFNYLINKSIIFGAEIIPNCVYSINNSYSENITKEDYYNYIRKIVKDVDSNGIKFNLSNSAKLSLIYQF
jgi:hypothetical protein